MDQQQKELISKAQNVDQTRLDAYMRMFDRVLLFIVAAKTMQREELNRAMDTWDMLVRRSIDSDVQSRTNILEGTPMGRVAKLKQEEDGEEYRLDSLEILGIAHGLISRKLKELKDDGLGPSEDSFGFS